VFVFVQVADLPTPESVRKLRTRKPFAAVGRILSWGYGTATDPSASWFELVTPLTDINQVRAETRLPPERVQKVRQIDRHEGRIQARQLELPGTGT
jgi:hypothetical protein